MGEGREKRRLPLQKRAMMLFPSLAFFLVLLALVARPAAGASMFNATALTIAGSGSSLQSRFMYQAADILTRRAKVRLSLSLYSARARCRRGDAAGGVVSLD